MTHYELIERAILYINENHTSQPSLDEVAKHVGLSPHYFQRLFHDWAGVSPKKFLQFLTIEQAKTVLQRDQSLLATSVEVGLSGTSRLHDLFITIEGMTPGEYRRGGQSLEIHYSFAKTQFGDLIIASTSKGICYLSFYVSESEGMSSLKRLFPYAILKKQTDPLQTETLKVFTQSADVSNLKLYLKGTPFQLKVWQALLQVPPGAVSTYADIARSIGAPKAVRAVGTAVGQNPVAYLIPCHRVIRSTGIIGNYRWGNVRKQAMLGWEAAKKSKT